MPDLIEPAATPVRFGVVGVGRWGRRHVEAIQATPGAELAGVVTASPESARRAEDEFGVPAFCDYQEMVGRVSLGLDVVDVVAPNSVHSEVAIAAIESGCHVLIEKPMGISLDECDSILSASRRYARIVIVGHEYRLSPLWGRVKAEIDAGTIGEPTVANIHLWRRSFRPGSGGWRHDQTRVGSWMLEQPIHFFDLARWYLARRGDPTAVFARTSGREEGLKENIAAIVSFPGSAYAVISQTAAGAGHHQLAEVVGAEASLRLVWSGEGDQSREATFRLELARDDVAEELAVVGPVSEEAGLRSEIASVVASVRSGATPFADGPDGRWAVRLCLAAEQSALTRREVLV